MQISLMRRATAFRTRDGVFYALFEALRDANDEPSSERPVARCVTFGTLAQVTAWILARSADCEYGLLRFLTRPATPEMYVSLWQSALKYPRLLFTQPVFLDTKGPHATVPTDSPVWYYGNLLPRAQAKLRENGCPEVADRLSSGDGVVLDLHNHAKALAAVFGYDPQYPHATPARFVCPRSDGTLVAELAPKLPEQPARVPRLDLRRIEGCNRFVLRVGQQHAMFGTLDELYENFARTVATTCAMQTARGGLQAIAAFRAACKDGAATLDAGYGVSLHPSIFTADVFSSCRQRFTRLMRELQPFVLPGAGFVFPMDDAVRKGLADDLTMLPSFALDLVPPKRVARYARLRGQQALAA